MIEVLKVKLPDIPTVLYLIHTFAPQFYYKMRYEICSNYMLFNVTVNIHKEILVKI